MPVMLQGHTAQRDTKRLKQLGQQHVDTRELENSLGDARHCPRLVCVVGEHGTRPAAGS